MIIEKNITLRPIEKTDLEQIADWRNSPGNHKHFFSYLYIAKSNQSQWYDKLCASMEKIMFMIEVNKNKRSIGIIGFDSIDFRNQKAEFGNILIGDKSYSGKGYAKEASLSLLKYGFNELNLNRVYLRCYKSNISAIKMYEKCGFKLEGTLKDDHYSQGKFHNVVIMGILKREFAEI